MAEPTIVTIGCDVGDRQSELCILADATARLTREKVSTTPAAFRAFFSKRPPARVVLETGTHSGWMSALLRELGHQVVVANARQLQLISRSQRKSDRRDAELLARLGRADTVLLSPVEHRSVAAQADLSLIRARDALVRSRTGLASCVRGLVKTSGARLRSCGPEALHKLIDDIPESLKPSLEPLLRAVAKLTEEIRVLDERIAEVARARYPVVQKLTAINGVGTLTALAFVLTLEDPKRFAKSRTVGAFLGLQPRKSQSGQSDPELRITKAGDRYMRRLLVGSANYILGPFGKPSDLRTWGLELANRGGRRAKARAKVAVARKLAVLMHRLWVTDVPYQAEGYGKKQAA